MIIIIIIVIVIASQLGITSATDLSMFERVSAVMVHTYHLTYLSITLPPLEDTYISSKSDTYMMYPSDSQWRRPAEMHLPLSVKLRDLDCTRHCLSAGLRAAECYPALLGLHAYAEQVQCDRMGDCPREESLHACYVCETLCGVMSCRHGS